MKQTSRQQPDSGNTASAAGLPRRSGTIVIEMLVALILIGTVASILSVALHGVRILQDGERFDRLVDVELASCAARLQAEVAAGQTDIVSKIGLSEGFHRQYPQVVLSVEQVPDSLFNGDLQEWSVEIRRPAHNSRPESIHRVSVWTEHPDRKGDSGS